MDLSEFSRKVTDVLYHDRKCLMSRAAYANAIKLDRELDRWMESLEPSLKRVPSTGTSEQKFFFYTVQ